MSGDLHGATLIEALLEERPTLKIGAIAGPQMRKFPIQEFFQMESLQVMGFLDVIPALPKLTRLFFAIRNKILELNPKTVVFIDYPGLHLRLQRSLRKKGFQGKLVHMICPTVWAWGKKRIPQMAKNLDLLLTIFPFEKKCFENTDLKTEYIGHPLALPIAEFNPLGKFKGKILGIFPGSRKSEIARNLPIQLKIARKLRELDPTIQIAISKTLLDIDAKDCLIVAREDHYELMRSCHLAIATSGTVTLELALHGTPTVVSFAIKPLDLFLAQKIFRINLPFYAMPNIVVGKSVFPELFGPNLTEEALFLQAQTLFYNSQAREKCLAGCEKVKKTLGTKKAPLSAAKTLIDF